VSEGLGRIDQLRTLRSLSSLQPSYSIAAVDAAREFFGGKGLGVRALLDPIGKTPTNGGHSGLSMVRPDGGQLRPPAGAWTVTSLTKPAGGGVRLGCVARTGGR
jgi:hypothetical protein